MMRLKRAFSPTLRSKADLAGLDSSPVLSGPVLRKSIFTDACNSQWYWSASTPRRLRRPPSRLVRVWDNDASGMDSPFQGCPAMTALNARATALTSAASVSFWNTSSNDFCAVTTFSWSTCASATIRP